MKTRPRDYLTEGELLCQPDRLDNMGFINQCKHDSEQYAKILNRLTEAVREESED